MMQLQAVPGPAAAVLVQTCQQQQQRQQQQVQVTFTAGPEVVHGVLIPAVRVLQQLAVGVSSLSLLSSALIHQLHSITAAGSRLISQLDQLLGWAGKQERQQRLASQQALGERCGQLGLGMLLVGLAVAAVRVGRLWEVHEFCSMRALGERCGQLGLGLLLVGLAVAAVRVGRLWEVHEVCMARSRPSGWHLRMAGVAGLSSAWQYTSCCSQQLGLCAVGLLALYWLARASWQALLSSGAKGAAAGPSRAWQLDLLLFRGLVCSLYFGQHWVATAAAAAA
ncbi:hypothetical protein OEZ86_004871 [Tetradesmus obliquus]|nr:hypothetical protein OEZ86_004871 [Tetradesmus obliquus]